LKVREIDNFESLEEEWNGLLENNLMGNNVFLSWEWLSTWWKHFGKERRLLILQVEDRNKVLAIAPLMLSKYKLPGFGNIRKIEFVGSPHSDYHNFIILEKKTECLETIIDFLKSLQVWDWIELKELPEHTRTADLLSGLTSQRSSELKINKRTCNICPYLPLPNSFELLRKSLTKNLRQNLSKYLRIARERHALNIRKYNEAGFSVEAAMRIFVSLHQKRWRTEGSSGAFEGDDFRIFHMDIAKSFAEKGWLGLYFTTLDDEPVSAQYNFEYGQKMYNYLSGFDPEYSNYSIGNLTMMFVLEECIKRGFKEYDMTRGNEPYKTHWTREHRRNLEVRLVCKALISAFYNWLTWNRIVNNLAAKFRLSLKSTGPT
jgi:CelD/BcsL family acetyltransferase involved in cellulose biosynthesis